MIHENAVLTRHPKAKEFRPVKKALGPLLGWTFEIPSENSSSLAIAFGWVTCDGESSKDILRLRKTAEGNLRSYMRSRTTPAVAIDFGGAEGTK